MQTNKLCCSQDDWSRCFSTAPATMSSILHGLTAFLQYLFSDPKYYAEYGDALQCLIYSANPADKTIDVSSSLAISSEEINSMPSVSVTMPNGVSYKNPSFSPESSISDDTATITQTLLASTDVNITCGSTDPSITNMLADLCLLFMFSARSRMFETWGWLLEFIPTQQSDPKISQVDTANPQKTYEASVVIHIEYAYTTTLSRESKRLKDFTLDSNTP